MEEPTSENVKLKIPDAYVGRKVHSKINRLIDKSTKEKILGWGGSYIIKSLFYLYLFRKYKAKCIVFKDEGTPTLGLVLRIENALTERELATQTDIAEQIAKCVKRGEKIVIIPLSLMLNNGGHANVLIYRKNTNMIERFDPQWMNISNPHTGMLESQVENKMNRFITILNAEFEKVGLPSTVTLKQSNDVCPHIYGFQTLEEFVQDTVLDNGKTESGSGYCLAWCMFFTELCLRNPTVSSDVIFDVIYDKLNVPPTKLKATEAKKAGLKFKNIIRGYSHFISEKIEKYFSILFKSNLNVKTILENDRKNEFVSKMNDFLRNLIYIEMKHANEPNFNLDTEVKELEFIYGHQTHLVIKQMGEDKIHLYKNLGKLADTTPVSLTPQTPKTQTPKMNSPKPKETPVNKTRKVCPDGKVLNEKGNCVNEKKTRSTKRENKPLPPPPKAKSPVPPPQPKIPTPKTIQPAEDCPPGKVRSEKTGKCINGNKTRSKKTKTPTPQPESKKDAPSLKPVTECPAGQVMKCVNV
jgi:hypothetical protein